MSKFVAVSVEGELKVHGPSSDGNYYTLCGLAGDDPGSEQVLAAVPSGVKINCKSCRMIWEAARKLKRADFA